MLSFLPEKLSNSIYKIGLYKINEIRIRKNCNVLVVYNDLTKKRLNVKLTSAQIEKIIVSLCNGSIYAFEEQIKNGYITTNLGVRVGISGEFVYNNSKIQTIKNFNSLCIRIPHEIKGVSNNFALNVYNGGSVLIISPSGVGKTTFLRDFIFNLSENLGKNIVVIDERNEIACINSDKSFNLGSNVDVLTYSHKDYGFSQAIRTLNPDVIIADEITTPFDVLGIVSTIYGGTSVVCTVHSDSIDNAYNRKFLSDIKSLKVFDFYVLILYENNIRRYKYFDKNYNEICL